MSPKPRHPSRLPPHRCAAPGCDKTVPGEVLMCYPHWRLVPRKLAAQVTRTWRAFSADPFDQAARDDYNRAREEAIRVVAAAIDAKVAAKGAVASGVPR